jgi:hypothetical protein
VASPRPLEINERSIGLPLILLQVEIWRCLALAASIARHARQRREPRGTPSELRLLDITPLSRKRASLCNAAA